MTYATHTPHSPQPLPEALPTEQDIIDKFSPIVRGQRGVKGALLKTVALPGALLRDAFSRALRFPIYIGHSNTAGQEVLCSATVAVTLARIEKRLQKSFSAATAPKAPDEARHVFLTQALEAPHQARVLLDESDVRASIWSMQTEPYRFIVRVEKQPDGSAIKTSLPEAMEALMPCKTPPAALAPARKKLEL